MRPQARTPRGYSPRRSCEFIQLARPSQRPPHKTGLTQKPCLAPACKTLLKPSPSRFHVDKHAPKTSYPQRIERNAQYDLPQCAMENANVHSWYPRVHSHSKSKALVLKHKAHILKSKAYVFYDKAYSSNRDFCALRSPGFPSDGVSIQ